MIPYDVLIAGGGLSGSLAALRLKEARPESRILLLEAGEAVGGEHTWSFHESDLEPGELRWLSPLVSGRWEGYTVDFGGQQRAFRSGYRSIRSPELRARLERVLGAEGIRVRARVKRLAQREAELESGETLRAWCVLDARGERRRPEAGGGFGFQKFVGLDVRLEAPHGLAVPSLMDARCEQLEGFRFVYLLPWSEDTLLIEDTRYSDSPALDEPAFVREIEAYARARGWKVAEVLRRERGVLPIPLRSEAQWGAAPAGAEDAPAVGVRGGYYHATTGYSLPEAVRAAGLLASVFPLTPASAREVLRGQAGRVERDARFLRLLNRMLFRAAAPQGRRRVMEKFYALPEPLIARFYAARGIPVSDKLRILSGRPPVPVFKALQCAVEGL